MVKQVKGSCYNISIYRTANCVELLSIMVKDVDSKCWKFNLGEWSKFMKDYDEIVKLMSQLVIVEVDENAQGMQC